MADPRDFLLNTDYEMDKVIYFIEGTLNAGSYDVKIPHDLGFAPLLFGVCAFNSDFSDARAIPFEWVTQSNTIQFNAYSTSSDFILDYLNYEDSTSKIYYRIYCFEPSTVRTALKPTSDSAKTFMLNTDYNYCKLFAKGVVNGDTTTVVNHNLGYIPQVLVWAESNGHIWPLSRSDWGDFGGSETASGVVVTATEVRFEASLYQYDKMHYRIYHDEA